MGASPHTPSLGIINGIVREESACGGQRLCEHVFSGKLASGAACKNKRFLCSAIRVERRVWQ